MFDIAVTRIGRNKWRGTRSPVSLHSRTAVNTHTFMHLNKLISKVA